MINKDSSDGQSKKSMRLPEKFTRYLLYAIGEILLVMIGILLAIQVNSYYNNLKDRQLEKSLLLELRESIKNDTINIVYDLKMFKRTFDYAQYLDSITRQGLPYEKKVDTAFAAISIFNVSEANYVPFDKVKSLKNGIIQNDSLFNALSRYYNFSRFLAEVDRYFEIAVYFRKDIYTKYASSYKYGSLAEVADYKQFLNSNEIKVAIDYSKNDAFFYLNRLKVKFEGAKELIEKISIELKRFDDD